MALLSSAASKYGPIWGRGYENLVDRRILSIIGNADHATSYLQGLVTSDLYSEPRMPRMEEPITDIRGGGISTIDDNDMDAPPPPPIRFTSMLRPTCFLDHRGRVITDALLWKRQLHDDATSSKKNNNTTEYLIDVHKSSANVLLSHLQSHKLRRTRIKLNDVSDKYSVHAVYGTLNADGAPRGYMSALDPRHPSLGMRVLSVGEDMMNVDGNVIFEDADSRRRRFMTRMDKSGHFPHVPGTYSVLRRLSGIAEGYDELSNKTALETNQEFLGGISFDKGCYLGQELTARTKYTGVVRKRILPLMIIDTNTEVPSPWIMAGLMQELLGGAKKKEGGGGGGGGGGMESVFGRIRTVGGGEEKGGDEEEEEEGKKGRGEGEEKKKRGGIELGGRVPPPLPRLSASGAGSIASMLMGSVNTSMRGEEEEYDDDDDDDERRRRNEGLDRLRRDADRLREEVRERAAPGSAIIDVKDGKIIGRVVSTPASGTTVILAQMRLDRLGLLGGRGRGRRKDDDDDDGGGGGGIDDAGWSRTNRILFGDGVGEYRYLPYLPLWWPEIDRETGKEKEEEEDEGEEELDEL